MTILEVQKILNKEGFGKLIEDGKSGPKTISAIKAFQTAKKLVADGLVGTKTIEALMESVNVTPAPKKRIMTQSEVIKFYGQPGPDNLTIITLPFPLKISWDTKSTTTRIQCHKKIAEPLLAVFNELLQVYGREEMSRLQIDMYGGCYNYRKMRGGTSWSKHAWGIAIDLNPDKNMLTWGRDKAQFAKPEYKKMIDIFYKHGFCGLGPEENRDWMHFEIGL